MTVSPIFHAFASILAFLFIGYVVVMIRRGSLQIRFALIWLAAAMAMFLLALFPGIIVRIALLLGMTMGISALFFFGILVCLILLFQHSVNISRLEDANRRLTQEIGLLKSDLDERRGKTFRKEGRSTHDGSNQTPPGNRPL